MELRGGCICEATFPYRQREYVQCGSIGCSLHLPIYESRMFYLMARFLGPLPSEVEV